MAVARGRGAAQTAPELGYSVYPIRQMFVADRLRTEMPQSKTV